MPRYALRTIDPQDPRPSFADDAVLVAMIDLAAPTVVQWARGRTRDLDPIEARFAILTAIRQYGVDAFRVGLALQANFHWPVDITLVKLLDGMVESLPATLRHITNEWVVRTGLRFPGKEGDTVEYLDERGEPCVGIVQGVLKAQARAFVLKTTGDLVDPEPLSVPAEAIYANVTQSRYAPEHPPLGLRYLDAPRLGALSEAARRNPDLKAKARAHLLAQTDAAAAPTTAHPLAGLNDFGGPDAPLIA